MEIKRIRAVYWSAAGTTERLVLRLAESLAERLDRPLTAVDFTPAAARATELRFAEDELAVVGSPTYAGRLPNKILPDFQTKLLGGGAPAVPVVLFGNRGFDNALAELCAVLEADGFHTVAAAAFVGQHAFAPALGAGRPDGADLALAAEFAGQIADQVKKMASVPGPVSVPGDPGAPYYTPLGSDGRPAKFLRAKPKTETDKCTGCGLCAAVCPMGAIDPGDVSAVPGTCIKCQACVRRCPAGAKFFDDPAFLSHRAMLEAHYGEPKKNRLYL